MFSVLSFVLAVLAVPFKSAARFDPANEHREPALGRAAHPWGELLGFEVAQSSVAKYMVKRHGSTSQGWRTFLRNHAPDIAAMDCRGRTHPSHGGKADSNWCFTRHCFASR